MPAPVRSVLRTFVGLSSFEMMAMFRRGLFYTYLSVYLRHYLGMSVTETTLFATLPMIANILCQTFVWGKISDRFQVRRTLMITGELLAAVGTVVGWWCHRLTDSPFWSGYIVILGLCLIEIFWSMSNIGWSALISDVYDEKSRNRIQGQLASLGGVGRIIGVWTGALLYDGMGRHYLGWGFYEGPLFFAAAAAMVLSTIPLLFVPEGGVKHDEPQSGVVAKAETGEATRSVFLFFLVAMALINFGRNSVLLVQPQYLMLEEGLAISSGVLGYIVNTQSVAMIAFGVTAGWLAARWGTGQTLLSGTLAAIVSLFLIAASRDLKLIYLSYFLRGFSEVIIIATSYTIASVLIPAQKRGRQFAMYNATFFLSWGVAGTFLTGPIADILMKLGHSQLFAYRVSFYTAAGMTLVGFGLMVYLVLVLLPRKGLPEYAKAVRSRPQRA